jgi:hypothetical protein
MANPIESSLNNLVNSISQISPVIKPAIFPSRLGIRSLRDICTTDAHHNELDMWLKEKNIDISSIGLITKIDSTNRIVFIEDVKVKTTLYL